MKNKTISNLLLAIGIIIVVDGILSIYFGNQCLNACLNNGTFGNAVRIVRAILGGALILIAFKI